MGRPRKLTRVEVLADVLAQLQDIQGVLEEINLDDSSGAVQRKVNAARRSLDSGVDYLLGAVRTDIPRTPRVAIVR